MISKKRLLSMNKIIRMILGQLLWLRVGNILGYWDIEILGYWDIGILRIAYCDIAILRYCDLHKITCNLPAGNWVITRINVGWMDALTTTGLRQSKQPSVQEDSIIVSSDEWWMIDEWWLMIDRDTRVDEYTWTNELSKSMLKDALGVRSWSSKQDSGAKLF